MAGRSSHDNRAEAALHRLRNLDGVPTQKSTTFRANLMYSRVCRSIHSAGLSYRASFSTDYRSGISARGASRWLRRHHSAIRVGDEVTQLTAPDAQPQYQTLARCGRSVVSPEPKRTTRVTSRYAAQGMVQAGRSDRRRAGTRHRRRRLSDNSAAHDAMVRRRGGPETVRAAQPLDRSSPPAHAGGAPSPRLESTGGSSRGLRTPGRTEEAPASPSRDSVAGVGTVQHRHLRGASQCSSARCPTRDDRCPSWNRLPGMGIAKMVLDRAILDIRGTAPRRRPPSHRRNET